MLRQLLSTTNGVVGSGNTSSSDYEHYSTYPLTSRNFENSTVILATPLLSPAPLPSLPLPLPSAPPPLAPPPLAPSPLAPSPPTPPPPLQLSSQPSQPSTSILSSSSSTSTTLPLLTETVSTVTSQNQSKIDDDKNLATLEYVSLTASYGIQTPITSNQLGILDTNNDLNDTTELFSSTYAMLSADSSLSWNVWDEQTRFSNCANDFGANEVIT